jgi:hypothetical protein
MQRTTHTIFGSGLGMTLLSLAAIPACAQITNGGFEAGATGWTRLDQVGSDGTFFVHSGNTSPVNGFSVPSPPEGTQAMMTDAGAGGSHVLYQDIAIPLNVRSASLAFEMFLNSGANFVTPATLDWAATNPVGGQNLNQQARVDFLTTTADPFSVASADVLQNVFRTLPTDPLTTGYTTITGDITALLAANGGQTLRLRFAEVDNVSYLNFGVDNVRLTLQTVPEPSSMVLLTGLCGSGGWLMHARRRKRGV